MRNVVKYTAKRKIISHERLNDGARNKQFNISARLFDRNILEMQENDARVLNANIIILFTIQLDCFSKSIANIRAISSDYGRCLSSISLVARLS